MKRWFLLFFLFCLIQPSIAYTTIEIPLLAEYGRGMIYSMSWNPNGDVLAVSSGSGLWLYDAEFNTLGHWGDGNVGNPAWSENGTYLTVSLHENDKSSIYILNRSLETLFSASAERYSSSSFAWHGERLAYSFDYEDIHIVDAPDFRERSVISNRQGLSNIAWSPDGSQLLGIGSMNLWLWDVETGEVLANYVIDNEDSSDGYQFFRDTVLWDEDSLSVLCTNGDYVWSYHLCEWDWATNTVIWSEGLSQSTSYLGEFTFFSVNEFFFISYGQVYPNSLMWRNAEEYGEILRDRDISTYALHPDGETMSLGTREGELIHYDLSAASILHEAELHGFQVSDLAWHPSDGRLAVAGHGFDYDVQILQLNSDENQLDKVMAIPIEISQGVAWSEDGTELFIGGESYGDTVNLWTYATYDAASYEQISVAEGQDDGTVPGVERLFNHAGDLEAEWTNGAYLIQISNGVEVYLHSNLLELMLWSPDDNYFAVIVGEDTQFGRVRYLFILETEHWELIRHERWSSNYYYTNVGWSPDSQYISYMLTSIFSEENYALNIRFLAMPNAAELPPLPTQMSSRIFWSFDGSILLVQNIESIDFYEFPSQDLLTSIETTSIELDWRSDGHYLATSMNGRIAVWDTSALFARD